MRTPFWLLALVALIAGAGLRPGAALAADPTVEVPGSASAIAVDSARGELEDATIVVRGAAGRLSARMAPSSSAVVAQGASVLRVMTTQVNGSAVPDPLPPLAQRPSVAADSTTTLIVRFRVPDATPAGAYGGDLVLALDGREFATVPVQLRVYDVQLPSRSDPSAFRTLFLIQPEKYVAAVAARIGVAVDTAGPGIVDRFFALLSDYRISPGNWGYGMPFPDGYRDRAGWTQAAATRMAAAGANPFRTMRLPLGTQRTPAGRSGQSARAPETWAAYLQHQVLPFWTAHGWLDRALVWGWDEPGPAYGHRYVTPQACAAHAAGVPYLTTGAPTRRIPARRVTIPWGQGTRSFTIAAHGIDNGFLWDARGCDDVDIWAVLSRRFYGSFATPVEKAAHIDAARELRAAIRTAQARGAAIWSFTYQSRANAGSPGYAASEPATDARVLGLWNGLEGIAGTLYADGLTTYRGADPYRSLAHDGQHVLIYPALAATDEPVSSLRLENLRDGIEDADLARMVVAAHGRPALLAILARERIFSIRRGRLLLGCTAGCDIVTRTKYAWPRYRDDTGTGAALERVHSALLRALAPAPA